MNGPVFFIQYDAHKNYILDDVAEDEDGAGIEFLGLGQLPSAGASVRVLIRPEVDLETALARLDTIRDMVASFHENMTRVVREGDDGGWPA